MSTLQGTGAGDVVKQTRTTYLDRGLQLKEYGLVDKNFAGLGAQVLYLVLLELDGLARSVPSHWRQRQRKRGQVHFQRIITRGSSPSRSRSMTESRSISVVVSAMSSIASQRRVWLCSGGQRGGS